MNSLRDYFNVYAVRSKEQETLLNNYAKGFDIKGSKESKIDPNPRALAIASSVPGFKKENSMISVIVNQKTFPSHTSWLYNSVLAYAYSDISNDSSEFRSTILHETVGHGIGKLDDEYNYRSSCVPLKEFKPWHEINLSMNVSLTNDPQKVPWAEFLKDKRYASEGLGIFEGGGTCYEKGVWRASRTSIMESVSINSLFFNAPSRRAIYDHVMQVTTGRTPTYEEFVQFDLAYRK